MSYEFDPATGGNRYVPDQDPPISVPGDRKLTAEEIFHPSVFETSKV